MYVYTLCIIPDALGSFFQAPVITLSVQQNFQGGLHESAGQACLKPIASTSRPNAKSFDPDFAFNPSFRENAGRRKNDLYQRALLLLALDGE